MSRGLSIDELDRLIGERDYRMFLNPRNDLYREMNMKENPPARKKALELMSENPNLVRRPILVSGKEIIPGFDAEKFEQLASAK